MVITQEATSETIKVAAEQFFDHVEVCEDYIFIYFPELTVTNELDLSIDIKGLLVRMEYSIVQGKVDISTFEGKRTEYNLCQYIAGYGHSHLPARSYQRMSTFCLGVTELSDIIEGDNPVQDLDYVFGLVNAFVRNESISGVPHIKLESSLDVGQAVANILNPPVIKQRHVVLTAKKMTEANALEYNYVKEGILPKISIKSGNDELMQECLIACNLAINTADTNILSILKLKDSNIEWCDEEEVYYRETDEIVGEGSLEFDRFNIIPTQEELDYLQNTVQTGDLQKHRMYKSLETYLNKILNG